MLKATTVITMTAEGINVMCGDVANNARPEATIAPQVGVGAATDNPRKLKADSATTAPERAKNAKVLSDIATRGSTSRPMMLGVLAPTDRAAIT